MNNQPTLDRPTPGTRSPLNIGARRGVTIWLVCWLGAQIVGSLAVSAFSDTTLRVQSLAVASILGWTVQLAGLAWVSRADGSGRFATDYDLRLRPVDLLGVPLGAAIQFAVIPLVYLPLRSIWPDEFTSDRLEQTARQLADSATGGWVAVLIATVVIGAPIVEELVYRGLLQRSIANSAGPIIGWLATAGIFTLIHFRPYEYPGLFAFALIAGFAAMKSGRLGPSIMIHVGFNAAGLVVAFR